MTNFSSTRQHQLISTVIKIVEVYILFRIVLIRITGGVVIPSYKCEKLFYKTTQYQVLPLVILQQ